jgi:tetratricopeptide (TPR) repeat protein
MRMRTRIAILRGGFWPAVLVVIAGLTLLATVAGATSELALALVAAAAVALIFGWWPLGRRWLGRACARSAAAIERARDEGDDDAAITRWYEDVEELGRFYKGRIDRFVQAQRAFFLARQERWTEALGQWRSLDRARLAPAQRVLLDNGVAWCLALTGATGEAVELARAAVAAEADADAKSRAYLHGTLGAALVLDGRHAEALAPLERALAAGGPRWAQAVRGYYLGCALSALGRVDEARAAWQRAADVAPATRYGHRAREQLAKAAAHAYR